MLKKTYVLSFALLFNFSFLISPSSAQPPLKGPLDGKTFSVKIYKEGKKKLYDKDELKFSAGKFKSKLFSDWGFTKASVYQIVPGDSASSEAKIYSWKAEIINDIKEKMTWNGNITGDDIEGTSEVVNTKGEKTYSFTFNGQIKGKKEKK